MNRYGYKMGSNDYFHKLSLGEIPGHSSIYKFGRNPSVGATTTIIAHGGIYGLPPTAETVVVTSDNINDVPLGTGARKVQLHGLNENWELISEEVVLGATSINKFIRVFRVLVIEAGTITPINGGNQGTITIAQSTSTINMIQIAPKTGQTLCACYTVPIGYKSILWSANTTTGEGKNALNSLIVRDNSITNSPFQTKGTRDNFENEVGFEFKIGNTYYEKSDIMFVSTSTASGTPVSGTFLLELIKL